MKHILLPLLIIVLILSIAWCYFEGGYEPLIVTFTSLIGVIMYFSNSFEKRADDEKSMILNLLINKFGITDDILKGALSKTIDEIVKDKKKLNIKNAIKNNNIQEAINLIKKDIQTNKESQIEMWFNVGSLAFFTDTNESLDAFKKVIELDNGNNPARLIYCDLLLRVGKYQEVVDLLAEMFEKDSAIEPKILAMALRTFGVAYKNLGELDCALDSYNDAIKVASEHDYTQVEGEAYSDIGLVYKIKCDFKNAEFYYKKALSLINATNKNITVVYGNLAVIFKYQKKFEDAELNYKTALSIDSNNGNKDGCARHNGNLGNLYKETNDLDKAIKHYDKALYIYKELGVKKEIAVCYINIGIVNQELGDFDDALINFEIALDINNKLHHKEGIALSKYNIASVQLQMGNSDACKSFLESSLSIYEELGVQRTVLEIKGALASLQM